MTVDAGLEQRVPVEIRYEDLLDDKADLSDLIDKAFGYHGLGLLTVSGIPTLEERRAALLPLARRFANLPAEVRAKCEHSESQYNIGWSHGKEALQGRPDFAKGSYYANPIYDRPVDNPELIKKWPAFIHPNIWPDNDLPQLGPAFKAMGQLVVEVGVLLARHCDKHIKRLEPTYPKGKLEHILTTSKCAKGRLLHYFPMSGEGSGLKEGEEPPRFDSSDVSNWCGWHNDHGSLTGLVSAMYLDAHGKEVPPPQDGAGLYIRSRQGELIKASFPPNHMAFQIGETAQIHSGGILQATPHAVKGSSAPGVSRETFAVFMEPHWDGPMDVPPGRTPEQAQDQRSASNLPPGVPPISTRWSPGIDFGEFSSRTFAAYY